jgi:hypothetical protein
LRGNPYRAALQSAILAPDITKFATVTDHMFGEPAHHLSRPAGETR